MASPFSIFRKNQKVMMAAITILAMAAFVLVNPFSRGNSGPQIGGSTPVATWNFGKIYLADVDNRLQSRHMVNAFLAQVFAEAKKKGGAIEGQRPPQFPESRQGALDSIVLHKKAEQLGLTVSDAMVNQYINAVGDDKLSGQELDAAARALSQIGMRPSTEQIVAALRFELEAEKLLELLESDFVGITPEQRYDYFGRLHRRAVIQVLPVEVKDFVNKVPNPGDSDLRALFEKYKEFMSSPNSPEPGFKVPPKAKFQYFEAKLDDFINAEKPKVTDDEIKKYYEENKKQFVKPDESESGSTSKSTSPEKPAAESATKPDQKNPEKPPLTPEKGAADKGGTEKPASDKGASDKLAPSQPMPAKADAEKKPSESGTNAPPPTPPAATKSATPPSADKPADTKTPNKSAPAPGKSSQLVPTSRRLLAGALLALAEADAPAVPKSPEPKSSEKPADNSTPKVEDANPSDANPSDAKPSDAKQADTKSTDAKPEAKQAANKTPDISPEKAAATTESPKAGSASGLPNFDPKATDPLKKIPIVEYKTLESVKDEIRNSIASERAGKQVDEALKSLRSAVQAYQGNYSRWVALQQGAEPQPPDFAALAKAKGVQFKQTGWLSAQEAYDTTDFGKSVVFVEMPDGRRSMTPVVSQAFDPRIQKFKPNQSESFAPSIDYLWWRVDYKEAYVPKFDDAKNEVLNAWKTIKARDLALTQAQQYADQVKKQQSELQEVFKFRPELHPSKDIGPFTWLSVPSTALNPEMQAPPQLSKVDGVEKIGDEFMRTVFTMDVGSTGKAMNAPQTIVYVIQLKSLAPGEDQFRRDFLQRTASRTDDSWRVERLESQQMLNSKIAAISSEFDFKITPEGGDALFGKGGSAAAPTSNDED
jgi:hypothetical protein